MKTAMFAMKKSKTMFKNCYLRGQQDGSAGKETCLQVWQPWFIFGTHMEKEEKLSPDLHMSIIACVYTHTHPHTPSKFFKETTEFYKVKNHKEQRLGLPLVLDTEFFYQSGICISN